MRQNGARRPSPDGVELLGAVIVSFGDCDAERLRLQWRNHLGGVAPAHLPRWLLLRLLVYRMQAARSAISTRRGCGFFANRNAKAL
jgi:hypothetical protein